MSRSIPAIDTVFSEAIEIPSDADRAAFVDRMCGEDDRRFGRVESLLSAHFRAGEFLKVPNAPPIPAEWLNGEKQEECGSVIGPYQIMERIGEGGMGDVYVAEQTDPVQRRVALKILKPGLDSREILARFNLERQALALMDHPNIAKVFDAGATPAGRPYFVMELVRGLQITSYCDQAKLPTQRRLHLFIQYRAVQHAHQKGIIHRDIKPSNILVTMHDGEPVPKVIDFGVAKATNPELGGHSVYTRFSQMIGTPLYMSPEQAELSAVDIDTRSDVYSLGVLLYELLAGTTPFDPQSLHNADFDEMRRMIREDEPPRPSARLSTLEASTRSTVSSRRGLDERQLSRLLNGDLDWIVMKALEKDRNRRYESAGAFAADIERYLANEPVEARPPSKAYRVRKFVRRNRAALAAATAVTAALLAGAGAIGWSAWHTASRRAEAEGAAAEAMAEADRWEELGRWTEAKAALDRAAAVLGHAPNADLEQRRRNLAFVKLLDAIQLEGAGVKGEYFDIASLIPLYANAFRDFGLNATVLEPSELAARLPSGPIRKEIVTALDDWAQICRRSNSKDNMWQGLISTARLADLDPWRDQLRNIWEQRSPNAEAVQKLVATAPPFGQHPFSVALLMDVLEKTGNDAQAVEFLREVVRRSPADFFANVRLAHKLASAKPPRNEEALGYFRAALAIRPESPGAYLNVGQLLSSLGRFAEADLMYEEALRIKPDYAMLSLNLGFVFFKKGQLARAEELFLDVLRMQPENWTAHFNLGIIRFSRGQVAEAAQSHREAARLKPSFALAHSYYGSALRGLGRMEEARAAIEEGLRLAPDNSEVQSIFGTFHCDVTGEVDRAIPALKRAIELGAPGASPHYNLGVGLHKNRQLADAEVAFREAVRLDPNHAAAFDHLSGVLSSLGKLDEAVVANRETVRISPENTGYRLHLGNSLISSKQYQDAIEVLREASRLAPESAEVHCSLGSALRHTGKHDEAVAAYREAIRLDQNCVVAHANLSIALGVLNKTDESIAAAREAVRLAPTNAGYQFLLGTKLLFARKHQEAIALLREAVRLKPDYPEAQHYLGIALHRVGLFAESVAVLREAVRIDKNSARAYSSLAVSLNAFGKSDEAIAALREAIRLEPMNPSHHYNLASVLNKSEQLQSAIDSFREAIRLKPDYAEALCNLGNALKKSGQLREALTAYRRGHELGSKIPGWKYPSEQWVKECEALVEAAEKAKPADAADKQPPKD